MNAIWIAVAAISLLGLAFGAILGYASRRFAVEDDPVVEKIDEILPQSQCGQCGYPAVARMRRLSVATVKKSTAAPLVAKQ